MDSAKTPSAKGSKGEVTVFEDAGRLKVNLPRQYFGGQQVKKALGLKATPENWALAERMAKRMTLDLQQGCFDDTLVKYGVKSNLKLITSSDSLPPKPKLGTLEIWKKYLEYKEPTTKKSHYAEKFEGVYHRAIQQAVETVGDNPVGIRTWLLSNRCFYTTKMVLSHLSHAYRLAIKQGLIANNPFDGMADELPLNQKNQKVNVHDSESDKDLYNTEQVKKKAFTVVEMNAVLEYVKQSQGKHHYPILQFLFLTGCRTSEAIALMWGDIKWNKEYIVIQRSYSPKLKEFTTTKTNHTRLFPMPKNGQLWNMLKSLDEGKPNDTVFKSKNGKIINRVHLSQFWHGSKGNRNPGVIATLIKQGRISKYLPLYNTRHTFISYQINECGIPPHVVKDWCGHSEKITSGVYREEDTITKPVEYGKLSASDNLINQPSQEQLQTLQQQNQMLQEQLKALQELVANLQAQLNSRS